MSTHPSPHDSTADAVAAAFAKLQPHTTGHHVFLCVGPECCAGPEGLATWEQLKQQLKELGIPALRTKAACLRICSGGPWLVVYPDGIWYGAVTPERCTRIVQEHLRDGHPIREWISLERPLGAASAKP